MVSQVWPWTDSSVSFSALQVVTSHEDQTVGTGQPGEQRSAEGWFGGLCRAGLAALPSGAPSCIARQPGGVWEASGGGPGSGRLFIFRLGRWPPTWCDFTGSAGAPSSPKIPPAPASRAGDCSDKGTAFCLSEGNRPLCVSADVALGKLSGGWQGHSRPCPRGPPCPGEPGGAAGRG